MTKITQDLIVEEARCEGRLVGWRVSIEGNSSDFPGTMICGETFLVWRDGSVTMGFRLDNRFRAGLGPPIEYVRVVAPRQDFLGEGI